MWAGLIPVRSSFTLQDTNMSDRRNREHVYEAIDSERDYQDRRWPGHTHSIPDYILFMEDYLAEARHMVSRSNNEASALDTIRKVAALAVVCMEEHGAPVRTPV